MSEDNGFPEKNIIFRYNPHMSPSSTSPSLPGSGGHGTHVGPGVGGYGVSIAHPSLPSGGDLAYRKGYAAVHAYQRSVRQKVEADYNAGVNALPQQVGAVIAQMKAELLPEATTTDGLRRVKSSIETLLNQTAQEHKAQLAISLAYDGLDPTPYPVRNKKGHSTSEPESYSKMIHEWAKSFEGAYRAKLLEAQQSLLAEQLTSISTELAIAENSSREAAEKAIAETVVREAAEKAAAELAAREAAEKAAAEKAEQEAVKKAAADKIAREIAEKAAIKQAATSRVPANGGPQWADAERAFREGAAKAGGGTPMKAVGQPSVDQAAAWGPWNQWAAQVQAYNQANTWAWSRLAEAQYLQQMQQQAARQAMYGRAGTLAWPANVNGFSVVGRGMIVVGETAIEVSQAFAEALAALARIALNGPGAVVAALVYSSSTASEAQDRTPERFRHFGPEAPVPDNLQYGFSLKAETLGLPPNKDLQAIALAQGTVDMPLRLLNERKGDQSIISVVSTKVPGVSKAVPVRAATFNVVTGLYEVVLPSTTASQPPITLTWTPASPPGVVNPSSTTPAITQGIPIYPGATVRPLSIKPLINPGVLPLANDTIIHFPIHSGIAPVYVMFSEPLDSGIFTRRQLQKKFDSHKKDFGFEGQNANNRTLAEFRDKIRTHLNDPATVEKGTFHPRPNSKVYFNPKSNLVVIVGGDGMFISGWKICPGTDQYDFYMDNEVL
ncbi:HNH nuclease [Pseudomonas sp. CCM 7893]|uniref:HNH nuclease n=1 Tax=Pseudomonas spelaei TaxID=1055469 RepID=A0A6I3WC49_9PSED|nr:S-type pyocin domain-containing protein [Pseudomonas spelaei]MUF07825.1 HNH nuclease [Pseudomonas spelaei]